MFELSRTSLENRNFFTIKARSVGIKIQRMYNLVDLAKDQQAVILLHENVIISRKPQREFTFQDGTADATAAITLYHNRYIGNSEAEQGLTASVVQVRDTFAPHGPFALKKYDFSKEDDIRDNLHTSLNEVDVLRRLVDHKNIVKLIEVIEESPQECTLVLEHMDGSLVGRVQQGRFTEAEAMFAAKQLLSGLSFMHDQHITHDDLKLDNLLYKNYPGAVVYKICDFGSSRIHDGTGRSYVLNYTPHYASPEVLAAAEAPPGHEMVYDHAKSDMFNFGVSVFCMLMQSFPFRTDEHGIDPRHRRAELEMTDDFYRLSHHARDFIRALLRLDPAQRPSARRALDHPWFNSPALRSREVQMNTHLNANDAYLRTHSMARINTKVTRRSARIEARITREKEQIGQIPLQERRNVQVALHKSKKCSRVYNRRYTTGATGQENMRN